MIMLFMYSIVLQLFFISVYPLLFHFYFRLSTVCLPYAGIESKRLNISSNFFSSSGSHTVLVFPHQTIWQYLDRIPPPPNGAMECRGV